MESILWSQGATPTENSVFVIDGKMNRDRGSDSNQLAYNKLIQMSEQPAIHPKLVQMLHEKNYVTSRQLMIAHKKGDGIFFKSVYKNLDESGRHVAYMFYCKTNDINHAYQVFQQYSSMADRVVVDDEEKMLALLFNLNKYVLIIATVILFITITLALWRTIN